MLRDSLVGLLLIVLCGIGLTANGQGTPADYERMLRVKNPGRDVVLRDRVQPHWLADDRGCWYRLGLPEEQHEFILVDGQTGSRQPAFDHSALAAALTQASQTPVGPTRLPFNTIDVDVARQTVSFAYRSRWWTWSNSELTLTSRSEYPPPPAIPEELPQRRGRRSTRSPDNALGDLFIRDRNLWRRDRSTGAEALLTTDGGPQAFYENRFDWSPEGTHALGWRTIPGEEHKVYLIESSPRDQVQPKLHTLDYHKPGDKLPITQPVLIDVAAGRVMPLSTDLWPNPWSITEVAWSEEGHRVSFLYNQRGHQTVRLIEIDVTTGSARTVIEETSPTFVDYAHKVFLHRVAGSDELIWMTERSGWNHLVRIDGRTGTLTNPITQGNWVVRGVDRVDDAARQIWFRAGGLDPAQDPYFVHHCRVNFDGTGLVDLTPGDGTHSIEWSPSGSLYLDRYSRVDLPPVTELRRARDGQRLCEVERAVTPGLNRLGWKPPERFVAKGRDGTTDIYGVIYRPTNFDPAKRYPVIECIYAGPHGAHVPKEFRPLHYGQDLAELGFIVVRMDGMGTSHRSKAFHDVCWKNLGDSGFPDRILWIKAAAAMYPQFDLSRVGIFGGSAGGQSTVRALEAHGDFYHVGVADCGCHDNRMDKVWWNELWMGTVGPHYTEQSNVTNAHKLQGKLLLVVGELDRNVDPSSTLQVADALIRADKDFELLFIPGAGHGAAESLYGQRRRADFFVRHLLRKEPRTE